LAVAFLEMEELSEPPKKRRQVPRGEVEKMAAGKSVRWEGTLEEQQAEGGLLAACCLP